MINSFVGFCLKDDFVYYMHNGSVIHCHHKDDRNSYRFALANLVVSNLCKCSELSRALGINVKNVQRYANSLRENGASWFFNRVDNRGQCYRFTPQIKEEAQELLNQGYSNKATGEKLGINESTIRYHIENGDLKKKPRHLQQTAPHPKNVT